MQGLLYYFGAILLLISAETIAVPHPALTNDSLDSVTIQKIPKQAHTEIFSRPLLPTREICGYQHSDDFFHNDVKTTLITEFPWLARLRFMTIDKTIHPFKVYGCVGSLINDRYILTSASCIPDDSVYTIEKVRLGEYNIINDTDCVNEIGIPECSDSVKDFGVGNITVHENFSADHPERYNIALIRLNATVKYSDYIRPICLPFPGITFAKVGDILTTSGWGFVNEDGTIALIKKRILGKLISFEKCYSLYKNGEIEISESSICTIPVGNNTELTCVGDAGSPVIFPHDGQWHQEGIVTIGNGKCITGFPGVMTKVADYLDWIVQNIKP